MGNILQPLSASPSASLDDGFWASMLCLDLKREQLSVHEQTSYTMKNKNRPNVLYCMIVQQDIRGYINDKQQKTLIL